MQIGVYQYIDNFKFPSLPRLYLSEQKYIFKLKIWSAPILKVKKEMCYVSVILLIDIKVNAKRIASAKFRKAKNKEISCEQSLFVLSRGIEPTTSP